MKEDLYSTVQSSFLCPKIHSAITACRCQYFCRLEDTVYCPWWSQTHNISLYVQRPQEKSPSMVLQQFSLDGVKWGVYSEVSARQFLGLVSVSFIKLLQALPGAIYIYILVVWLQTPALM